MAPIITHEGGSFYVDATIPKSRIINHMNDDHTDSILVYALHFAKLTQARSAKILDVSSTGMTLEVDVGAEEPQQVFVPYTEPLYRAQDLRKIVVAMHHECYDALGLGYKLRHGYYRNKQREILAILGAGTLGLFAFTAAKRRLRP